MIFFKHAFNMAAVIKVKPNAFATEISLKNGFMSKAIKLQNI